VKNKIITKKDRYFPFLPLSKEKEKISVALRAL
jgi:hypothetical protein